MIMKTRLQKVNNVASENVFTGPYYKKITDVVG